MNYRGYELENVSCDTSTTGREYLAYDKNGHLIGGTDTYREIELLIDLMIEQGAKHESEVV